MHRQSLRPRRTRQPKRGGILTYMIPADAPPSFDGHRETTYATVHSTAPFYSVLIRLDPEHPEDVTKFVCDLCTEMPTPTDNGTTYTFKIRDGVKWHDGSPLTAADVAASWNHIIHPPPGYNSARANWYAMVDTVSVPDPTTVVFKLKFATLTFLPALADPYAYIYKKDILDKDPHWYKKNIMGSGPFKFVAYDLGQSIKGERNPDYYHKGLPYLDGFVGIYADKQVVRTEAIRGDRAATEFRGLPPAAIDQLKKELGDKITIQTERLELRQPDHAELQEASRSTMCGCARRCCWRIDQWHGAPALSKIANVKHGGRHRVPRLAAGGDQGGAAADGRLLARHRQVARRGEAAAEGGGAGEPQLRDAEPQRRSAVQVCRHLAGR